MDEREVSIEIERIRRDRSHGASWILYRTVKLLKKIEPQKRAEVCREIASSHPSMGGLKSLSRAVSKNPFLDLEKKLVEANKRTSENLRKLVKGRTVTSLSRSHVVESGLLGAKKAVILESNPGGEGRDMVEWLRARGFRKAELIPDASMASAVKKSDLVVVGADSLSKTGFVNKIGTLPLALTTNYFGKPFVVASPCYKFIESISIDETLFEYVPIDLVDFFVWEAGTIKLQNSGLDWLKKGSERFFSD
jgi:translation initiation factor eIF-2B subunit delta